MFIKGISTSKGIAIAPVYTYTQEEIIIPDETIAAEQCEAELNGFEQALKQTIEQLENIREHVLQSLGKNEGAIFDAHIMIAQDPSWLDMIRQGINNGTPAAKAAHDSTQMFAGIFSQMDDPYMKERGADILDIGDRLIRNILGMRPRGLSHINKEVILVAEDLTPSDTALLNPKYIKGFITAVGGPTSHAAIMARTLEIPALMGVGELTPFVDNELIIIDGGSGFAIINPTAEQQAEAEVKRQAFIERTKALKEEAHLDAITKDGHRVLLFGNIGKAENAKQTKESGAEGIGLFRTEFLYMEKDSLPTEDEQFEAYKKAVELMHPHPVIIRTLDIGGDKELPSLNLPKELNPFLGYRALRICLDRPEIFKTQLKALLRASHYGDVHVMLPMVQSVDEVLQAKEILKQAKTELTTENIPFNNDMPLGIMVEIPSVAVAADLFIKHVDFFSIGTNDLCQYTLAVDRMNEKISNLYTPFHPSVLRLIHSTIQASHKDHKITGMCGEMASDPLATMLLIGLGLDEFSMSAASIPLVKHIVRSVTRQECEEIALKALNMDTAAEIKSLLELTLEEKGIVL